MSFIVLSLLYVIIPSGSFTLCHSSRIILFGIDEKHFTFYEI